MTRRLPAVLTLILLTGCGPAVPGLPNDSGEERPPADRTFLSTAVTEQGTPRPLAGGGRITLRFTDRGELRADAGCNQLSGPAELADGRLVVTDLEQTEMGCDAPRLAQDTWLSEFLRGRPTWQLTGDELVLERSGVVIRFTDRAVADPDLPLVGTEWVVDTIVTSGMAGSAPSDTPAFLRFSADGRVTGSTGCNSLSGSAPVDGTTIRFSEIVTTRMACSGQLQRLEAGVLAALAGPAEHKIRGGRLTLTGPNGAGLVLGRVS